MKVITIMFLGLLCLTADPLLAQNYSAMMEKAVLSYETIGQKLSAGSTDGLEAEAQTIITTTSDLLKKKTAEFPQKRSREFGILLKRINRNAQRLMQAKTLEDMRVEYDVLSHPVIAYQKMFGAGREYNLYACEGDMNLWIQSKKEPQADPYCDTACGMVIGEIPRSKDSEN